MQNSITRTVALAVFGLVVAAGAAQAQGKGHKGHGHGDDRDEHPAQVRGHDRDDDQGRGYGNGGVPPGLAKKGGMPPGQAKKYYRPDDGVSVLSDVFGRHGYTVVRTVPNGDARYVYYRYHDGGVHRAIGRPYNDQLSFVNVPNALLREVVSRLGLR